MYNSIKEFMPKLFESVEKIYINVDTQNYEKTLEKEFDKIEAESIDYGVMEKASNIYVIPGNFGWDDVGSWLSVERLNLSDNNNNIIKGNIVSMDSSNNIIINKTDNLLATSGLENMVVVKTEDAILVMTKESTNNIKTLIKKIEENESNKKFL